MYPPCKHDSSRLTVKQAAKLMNVSERSVYLARRLQRSGRDDLVEACRRGEMSLHAALVAANLQRKPTRLDALRRVWNATSEEERAWFLVQVAHASGLLLVPADAE